MGEKPTLKERIHETTVGQFVLLMAVGVIVTTYCLSEMIAAKETVAERGFAVSAAGAFAASLSSPENRASEQTQAAILAARNAAEKKADDAGAAVSAYTVFTIGAAAATFATAWIRLGRRPAD